MFEASPHPPPKGLLFREAYNKTGPKCKLLEHGTSQLGKVCVYDGSSWHRHPGHHKSEGKLFSQASVYGVPPYAYLRFLGHRFNTPRPGWLIPCKQALTEKNLAPCKSNPSCSRATRVKTAWAWHEPFHPQVVLTPVPAVVPGATH